MFVCLRCLIISWSIWWCNWGFLKRVWINFWVEILIKWIGDRVIILFEWGDLFRMVILLKKFFLFRIVNVIELLGDNLCLILIYFDIIK